MYLTHLFIIVSTIMCASSEMSETEEMYLNFFVQIESVKKSFDILKLRVDAMSEINTCESCSHKDNKFQVKVLENFGDLNTRLDALMDNSKNKQPYVDKETFDDLKAQFNAWTDKALQRNADSKTGNLESQQKILVQEISEMKGNYSNLLDELNTIKLSEKSFKEKYSDLEEKYLELVKHKENDRKSNNDLCSRTANITSQLEKKYIDLNEKYLELVKNKENDSKSNNVLSLRKDIITPQLPKLTAYEVYNKEPLFDVRVDKLPESITRNCYQDPQPTDCKTATICTKKSGYYKIYLPGNKAKQIMVFCDMEIAGGNWMHILRRIDGSENFDRPWADYVNGFGNVEGEYWIGLQNLNALTKNNGRQQLYVHLENPTGGSNYSSYNNFLVGNATEDYKLKSLGKYNGTGGDGIRYNLDNKFSTFDNDNDKYDDQNCSSKYGGWWHYYCTYSQPTGTYYKSGILWYKAHLDKFYSYKIVYFMIRSV